LYDGKTQGQILIEKNVGLAAILYMVHGGKAAQKIGVPREFERMKGMISGYKNQHGEKIYFYCVVMNVAW
jgi:hypothetical protein